MSGMNPCNHDLLQPATKKTRILYKTMITVTKVIQTFHDNIKSGPEYVCTFSDQLWYRSSVRKCEANKYRKYSATLLVTTTAIIDNAK